jgi:hypothetical protein
MDNFFEYREPLYFNDTDTFVFLTYWGKEFESKVHFEKGNWYTNECLNYKCTSVECYKKEK